MKYWLLIKSGCACPDFEDRCEADSKMQAAETFKQKNQWALMEFGTKSLLEHICEEPEAVKTDMF